MGPIAFVSNFYKQEAKKRKVKKKEKREKKKPTLQHALSKHKPLRLLKGAQCA